MKKQVFADPDVRAFLTAHQDQLTNMDASFASLYELPAKRQPRQGDQRLFAPAPMEGPLIGSVTGQPDKPGQAATAVELIDLPEKLRRVKL